VVNNLKEKSGDHESKTMHMASLVMRKTFLWGFCR